MAAAAIALVMGMFLGAAFIRTWDNRKRRPRNKDWLDVKVGLTD